MDSNPIASFLELHYPSPPLPLTSPLGDSIETTARSTLGVAFRTSVMPREVDILSARSQTYFRSTRERSLGGGQRLEDLLDGDTESQSWKAAEDGIRTLGELLRTNEADGPFVLGAHVSYADFFIVGNLQMARVVDEEKVFERIVGLHPRFGELYEACKAWMGKRD